MKKRDIAIAYGESLKNALIKKDMSQQELALTVGISESSVSHYLNGNRVPKMETHKKIVNCLGKIDF